MIGEFTMDELTKLWICNECQQLVFLSWYYVDHGQASKMADLFTEDAVFLIGLKEIRGKDEIRRMNRELENKKGRMTRHLCTNFLLTSVSETEAEGTTYLTLYGSEGEPGREVSPLEAPMCLEECRDSFAKTREGWRLARRELVTNFIRSLQA